MRLLSIFLLALITLWGISGCKNSSSKKKADTFDKPAVLPAAFEDSSGEMWTCIETDDTSILSGIVSFSKPVELRNADILHISLLEIKNSGEINLIATRCLNNIGSPPVAYQLAYNADIVETSPRYVLSAVFFTHLDDDTYVATYRPDGFLEVISNDLTKAANLILKVP